MKNINLDNSLTEPDSDVGDIRKELDKSGGSDKKSKDDMSSPEYYTRGRSRTKEALQQLCQEKGIAFVDQNTRQELAESLAQNYRNKIKDLPINHKKTTSLQRKQAFMNRMIKHWFMHPFTTHSDSLMNLGKEHESLTLNVLQNYIWSFSKNKYRGGKIREYGLLV